MERSVDFLLSPRLGQAYQQLKEHGANLPLVGRAIFLPSVEAAEGVTRFVLVIVQAPLPSAESVANVAEVRSYPQFIVFLQILRLVYLASLCNINRTTTVVWRFGCLRFDSTPTILLVTYEEACSLLFSTGFVDRCLTFFVVIRPIGANAGAERSAYDRTAVLVTVASGEVRRRVYHIS